MKFQKLKILFSSNGSNQSSRYDIICSEAKHEEYKTVFCKKTCELFINSFLVDVFFNFHLLRKIASQSTICHNIFLAMNVINTTIDR